MSVSSNSIRLASVDEYPYEFLITHISLAGYPPMSQAGGWHFLENPLQCEMAQPGYTFECLSSDLKQWMTWEVVNAYLFNPEKQSDETYNGVVVCGCKLVKSIPIETVKSCINQ